MLKVESLFLIKTASNDMPSYLVFPSPSYSGILYIASRIHG